MGTNGGRGTYVSVKLGIRAEIVWHSAKIVTKLHSSSVTTGSALLSQVTVDYSRRYDRKSHPEFDTAMNEEWARRLAANPKLFAQSKFRLADVRPVHSDAGTPQCRMDFGFTDYMEFVGTNMSPLAPRMREEGKRVHGDEWAFVVRALKPSVIRACECMCSWYNVMCVFMYRDTRWVLVSA